MGGHRCDHEPFFYSTIHDLAGLGVFNWILDCRKCDNHSTYCPN
jgi:hypothetical protein